LLVAAPDGWAPWRIELTGAGKPRGDLVDRERASIGLHPAGRLLIDRAGATATIARYERPSNRELVHPVLAAIAAVASWWSGRIALHAGAFGIADGCWAVLGDAGSGKSSLLASVAARGASLVADDLLVLDGASALAGPACIDLRADVAQQLGAGEPIGVVGGRERWRVETTAGPAALPLRGFVIPRWGETAEVMPVAPAERLPPLVGALALSLQPVRPAALLELAVLPMVALSRPRDLGTLDDAAAVLLDAL
jgi:hypothetical protein